MTEEDKVKFPDNSTTKKEREKEFKKSLTHYIIYSFAALVSSVLILVMYFEDIVSQFSLNQSILSLKMWPLILVLLGIGLTIYCLYITTFLWKLYKIQRTLK